MATVSDIRAAGTDLLVNSAPIPEPIGASVNLPERLIRFDPDIYNLTKDSHLFKFLLALCGDAGAGSLKKQLLYPRIQSLLGSTYFSDLDLLFGNVLLLRRLANEIYSVDPKTQALTFSQWLDVSQKDASYKSRALTWLRALKAGPTPTGFKLAAEAATGVECQIFERYKYLEAQRNGDNTVQNIGHTSSPNEVVIIPQLPVLSSQQERDIITLMDALKPQGTVVTVLSGTFPKLEQPVLASDSTSNYFNIQRQVTGTNSVNWPPTDPNQGLWITANVQQEAPTFAFMQQQEQAIFLTMQNVSASSVHIGAFNATQAKLFSHLTGNLIPPLVYSANQAVAPNPVVYQTQNPWIPNLNSSQSNTVLVNNYYPIDYFAVQPSTGVSLSPFFFWASNEEFAQPDIGSSDTTETLTVDLGTNRQANYIDFEICQKPIDIAISYSIDNITFTPVSPEALFEFSQSIAYFPSESNPWTIYSLHFDTVLARYFQITFTRRADPFPFSNSDPFQWSIEVRNLRIVQAIGFVGDDTKGNTSDVLTDSSGNLLPNPGVDFLGNTYTTTFYVSSSDSTTDGDSTTYWQSQPNPSPFAVEALYFDLRSVNASQLGTQSVLDAYPQSFLDNLPQSTVETDYIDGQVINEIWIDPVTTGCYMHIYWSNDDTAPWDNKLWTPVNKNFILKKGYVYLPEPILAKYIKIEFSNLTPTPYNPLDYPSLPPVSYFLYPSWVENYYQVLYPITLDKEHILFPLTQVTIDPLKFGYQNPPDTLNSQDPTVPKISLPDENTEIENIVAGLTNSSKVDQSNQVATENTINYFSAFMYQENLVSQLPDDSAFNRWVKVDQTNFTPSEVAPEQPVPASPPQIYQSVANLVPSEVEKKVPMMSFPFTCRHTYQIAQAQRDRKIAYFVAIREVTFYRKDYSQLWDEPFYIETLDDTQNLVENDFTQVDWRWVISP